MLFNSVTFLIFFSVVYGLYLVLPHRQQNYLLIAASFYFYAHWNVPFVFLMVFSIVFTFLLSLRVEKADEIHRRKKLLILGLTVHVGLLVLFKYSNFVWSMIVPVTNRFGKMDLPSQLDIALPLGISFYTFQALGYLIDVYSRELKPTRSFSDFALFKVFFPQLIAGPIERGSHLLRQITSLRHVGFNEFGYGVSLVLWGLFKKVAIADNLSPISDGVFSKYATLNALDLWVGVLSFTLQIFCDFSGYSDMARGMAKMMGFDLVVNFNLPFFACNPADFWRRWHISLSTWFRDYIYFPLMHRTGKLGVTLMITFLINGLWHGAGWNFVLLGLYWGTLVYVHATLLQPRMAILTRKLSENQRRILKGLSIAVMFQFTCLGFLLFRATDGASLIEILNRLFTKSWSLADASTANVQSVLFYFCLVLLVQIPHYFEGKFDLLRVRSPYIRYATFLSILYLFLIFCLFGQGDVGSDPKEFLYFQF